MKISRGIYKLQNGQYQVKVRRGSTRFTASFPTLKEAELAREEKCKEARHNEHSFLKEEQNPTLEKFIPVYISRYAKLKNQLTFTRVTSYVLDKFKDALGDYKLNELTPFVLDGYRAVLLDAELAPSTVNREMNVIHSLLAKAVEWGFIRQHPLKGLKKLEEAGHRLRFLSQEEYSRLLVFASGPIRDIILFGIATGLRTGNIRRLNIKTDADYKNHRIILGQVKGHGTQIKYIPMNETAKEILMRQSENCPWNYDFSGQFENVCKLAGIPTTGQDKVTPHTLRHTFASWLVMAGVSLFDVQKLLLHADIKSTMVYAHLSPDHLQESSRTIDGLLGKHSVSGKHCPPIVLEAKNMSQNVETNYDASYASESI